MKKILAIFTILATFLGIAGEASASFFMMQPQVNFTLSNRPYFQDGATVGNLDSSGWDEISGIAVAKKPANKGNYWAIDDGRVSPAIMLAISEATGASRGEWTLPGATGRDIECITTAIVGGQPYVWIGDIGDNGAVHPQITFWQIKEPTIDGSNHNLVSGTDFATSTVVYPASPTGESGATARDAESCFADPTNGDIYIITKRTTIPQVFLLPFNASPSGTTTLLSLGNMFTLPNTPQAAGAANGGRAVDANISPDGREILVKNYENLFLFKRATTTSTTTIYTALTQTPTTIGAYVRGGQPSSHPNNEPQGEGVSFDINGQHIFTASEYNATFDSNITDYPFFKYLRLAKAPVEVSFQQGTNSYSGATDTFIQSLLASQGIASSSDTTVVADWNSGTDERVGLFKWDISSIPTNARVVGCEAQMFINTEGAVQTIHRMGTSWSNTSTYTNLGGLPATTTLLTRIGDYAALTGTTTIKIPITECQNWVTTPATNQGLIFYGPNGEGNGFQWRSAEYPVVVNRPKLTVRYEIY